MDSPFRCVFRSFCRIPVFAWLVHSGFNLALRATSHTSLSRLSLLERVLTEPGRAVLLACFQDPAAAEDAWAEGLGAGFPRRGGDAVGWLVGWVFSSKKDIVFFWYRLFVSLRPFRLGSP